MSDRDDKLLLELADESRREFLKKLGKGLAMAGVTSTTGLKSGLAAAKKVVKLPSYVEKGDFDSYDALEYALDNMFEYGRAASELSMPLDLQQKFVISYSIRSLATNTMLFQVDLARLDQRTTILFFLKR